VGEKVDRRLKGKPVLENVSDSNGRKKI